MTHKNRMAVVKKGAVHIGTHYCDTDSEAQTWFNREYPTGHTVEIKTNPEIAKRAAIKAKWQAVTDSNVKALLKPLLKDLMDD